MARGPRAGAAPLCRERGGKANVYVVDSLNLSKCRPIRIFVLIISERSMHTISPQGYCHEPPKLLRKKYVVTP